MNLKELYQEIILEHGKNPRNLRKTEGFNKDAKGNNPLCGDNVHVYLKLNESEKTKLMCLSGVKQYPMRVKCATLSWHTLVSAFDDHNEEVKTEN